MAKKSAITVMEPTRSGSVMTRKRLLILGVACVLLVGALCAVVWLVMVKQQDDRVAEAGKLKVQQYSNGELRDMVVNNKGSSAELVRTLEGQEKTDQNLRLLATTYNNAKQYDKAYAIYDQLIAKNAMSAASLQGAGESAEFLGKDYRHALKYYTVGKQKTQDDKTDPLYAQNIRYFDEAIQRVNSELSRH